MFPMFTRRLRSNGNYSTPMTSVAFLPCFSFPGAMPCQAPLRSGLAALCPHRVIPMPMQGRPRRRAVLQCCNTGGPAGEESANGTDADLFAKSMDLSTVEEEEEELEQLVMLSDPKTGRTLQCGIDRVVEFADKEYFLCYPRHEPVFFAEVGPDDELVEVEDGPAFRAMIPIAAAVLAEEHITLQDTAFVLTVDEDWAPDVMVDDEEEEDDNDVDDYDDVDGEMDVYDGGDNVEILSEFKYEGRHILIAKPLEAALLVAEKTGDDFRVIVGDELEAITASLENAME